MNAATAICLSGLGLATGLGILLGIEPGWFTRWLFPEPVEVSAQLSVVPAEAGQS